MTIGTFRWMIASGQLTRSRRVWLTEPNTVRCRDPRPRVPTTSSAPPRDWASSTRTGSPRTMTVWTDTSRYAGCQRCSASSRLLRACVSAIAVGAAIDSRSAGGSGVQACTATSGIPRWRAAPNAKPTAPVHEAAGSMPTTTRGGEPVAGAGKGPMTTTGQPARLPTRAETDLLSRPRTSRSPRPRTSIAASRARSSRIGTTDPWASRAVTSMSGATARARSSACRNARSASVRTPTSASTSVTKPYGSVGGGGITCSRRSGQPRDAASAAAQSSISSGAPSAAKPTTTPAGVAARGHRPATAGPTTALIESAAWP